jgi:hypothetical protein
MYTNIPETDTRHIVNKSLQNNMVDTEITKKLLTWYNTILKKFLETIVFDSIYDTHILIYMIAYHIIFELYVQEQLEGAEKKRT